MKKLIATIVFIMMTMIVPMQAQAATVKIGDITHVKGVRNNQIVGYGIVVGLPGTGDNSRSTQLTNKLLLMNLGTIIEQENYIQKGSSAAVIVTATVPPFAKNGDQVIVTGKLNYHVRLGRLSFVASKVEPYGMGELYKKYLELKARLESEGVFDESHKIPLPKYANKIGAKFVIVVGENEIALQQYSIKDMQSGVQQQLSIDNLLSFVKENI